MDRRGKGIIYVAIRDFYVREACISAESMRAYMPDIPIILYTDRTPPDDAARLFSKVVHLTEPHPKPHLNKLICMRDSPFQRTLFLDTDTFACGSPAELFDLLDRFDVAMALERRYRDEFPAGSGVPDVFPEFNQGVVAFRQTPEFRRVVDAALEWAAAFHARTGEHTDDQIPMRIALYTSDLRIVTLPSEFNCRFHTFGQLNAAVKILHARIPGRKHTPANLLAIANKLNRETIPRVFVAGKVLTLGLGSRLSTEYYLARRGVSLFSPRWAVLRSLKRRFVRSIERSVGRFLRSLAR